MKSPIPVLPVQNVVVFPGTVISLRISRPLSMKSVETAQKQNSMIIIVGQREKSDSRVPSSANLYEVGTVSRLESVCNSNKRGYTLRVRGINRVRVSELHSEEEILVASGEILPDQFDLDDETSTMLLASIRGLAQEILNLIPTDTRELANRIDTIEDLSLMSNICGMNLNVSISKKQELLETLSIKHRSLILLEHMKYQKESLKLQREIGSKLSDRMTKIQREAILREQLNAIREELGEGKPSQGSHNYKTQIDDAKMPDDVKKIALEELERLTSLGNNSPESHVIRNYLDLLCALPWSKSDKGRINLDYAQKILDKDHYGLDKIKQRIIQHLAVMKLKKQTQGSILLLVGPPGVGKTSLGRSVAKTLGRRFVRASLGGVRDEAEIRGHRRTYIGAMPGRVIQGIKRAGVNNPVFMLDEIDKLSFGFSGDPASALLEVLDPEQNDAFLDHYLDVAFDLSKVFFIATANTLETIPRPLLDRLEVIEVSGYTTMEKLHIARNHLVPKQQQTHGIKTNRLEIIDKALVKIINSYTREAGVRELQRVIAEICRASSVRILNAKKGEVISLGVEDIRGILGVEKYSYETTQTIMPPGVVTGLAWTPMGGDILFIESSMMPGHGRLILTGQLGNIMKESANIAMSLVRSNLSSLLPRFRYNDLDIHIHVPAGAIPKDGPSAGITMMMTIASLFTGVPISSKLAMTGEITLRGAVMPVGGIKEKLLAASRAGVERVILPARNEKDLAEVSEEIQSKLRIEFVNTAADVLKIALDLNVDPVLASQHLPEYPLIVGVN